MSWGVRSIRPRLPVAVRDRKSNETPRIVMTCPIGGSRLGAAQQRPHSRQQLPDRERLGEVVVGTHLQPDHAVHDVALAP